MYYQQSALIELFGALKLVAFISVIQGHKPKCTGLTVKLLLFYLTSPYILGVGEIVSETLTARQLLYAQRRLP